MGDACSTHGEAEKLTQGYWLENLKERFLLQDAK